MTVLLVHGYLGFPDNCWFPWLRRELESRGHDVVAPAMPNPELPERLGWKMTIERSVEEPSSTILVGHSLGCLAILHVLQEYQGPPFAHVVLAAGFGRDFLHTNRLTHWFDVPLDFAHIASKAKRWTSVHSVNDRLVPFAEGEWLAAQLGAERIVENKGHLTKREGAGELPSLLHAILPTLEAAAV